ncbi:hypothetical protein [Geotalea sp. SG265]|uniref:hypothetical protein n=1 Tax=Geotalea sp. SG265 TaxID=2922867 RepID=UPI001FAEFB59|nr:hypothetical protein [Geotalea sp. SG265]
MSDKKNELKFKYVFDNAYNPVYVNGAHGGVTPRGELVVNFYLERQPLPNSISHEIAPNGSIGRESAVEPADLHHSFVRYISSGVVLSHQTAEEIHFWLGEKLKEMEAIEKAKSAMDSAAISDKSRFTH